MPRPAPGSSAAWETPAIKVGKGGKKGAVIDMPVSFVPRVRSSGYGESKSPRSSSRPRARSAPRGVANGAASAGAHHQQGSRIPAYPIGRIMLSVEQPEHRLPPTSTSSPILRVAYSYDAKLLGAVVGGGGCGALPCFRLPTSKHSGDGRNNCVYIAPPRF